MYRKMKPPIRRRKNQAKRTPAQTQTQTKVQIIQKHRATAAPQAQKQASQPQATKTIPQAVNRVTLQAHLPQVSQLQVHRHQHRAHPHTLIVGAVGKPKQKL